MGIRRLRLSASYAWGPEPPHEQITLIIAPKGSTDGSAGQMVIRQTIRKTWFTFWIITFLICASSSHGASSLVTIGSGASIATTDTADVCADARVIDTGGAFDGNWCGQPTVAELVYFISQLQEERVLLRWKTALEIDTSGFHVWRKEKQSGSYEKVTETLIPAKGSPTQGATYEFVDRNVEPGKTYYYKLEEIDTLGNRSFHGPVSATVPAMIPTMTETGLIIFGAIFFITSIVLLRRRHRETHSRLW